MLMSEKSSARERAATTTTKTKQSDENLQNELLTTC